MTSTQRAAAYDNLQQSMGVLLQIRDVPEEVHRALKMRAAAAGTTLTEYVRSILATAVARPTVEELVARIEARGPLDLGEPSEVAVRRLRDSGE